MCCNNRESFFIFLAVFAGFMGLTYFDNVFSRLVETLFDPAAWFVVAVVIAGSLIYKITNRRRESHQH